MTQLNPLRRPSQATCRWLAAFAVGASTLLVPTLTATADATPTAPDAAGPAAKAEQAAGIDQKLADVAAAVGEDSPQYEAATDAAATGQDVEVGALTTETNKLIAHPDGTFELQGHREAVRTKINGDWEPIDTTLVTNPDGTISPKAITLPVTFAGGTGTGPVATAGEGDESLAFTWDDGPLPQPVIDGNQVTYPNVRPGVDMVFSVNATGFSDALVVKTPAAADALAADPVVFTGTSEGLDLSTSADGSMVATDASGEAALVSPPPVAWDSSGGGKGVNEPTAESVGTGDVHELPAPDITQPEATPESSVTIEVAPPASALNDPDVVYPLYLDPQAGRQRSRWRTVQTGGWNYGPNSTDVMRVGYCDWTGCNDSLQENARSYFEFDLSPLTDGDSSDPTVFDARVQATQVWSASSSAEPVHLRKSGFFSNTETYPGPSGAFLQERSSAAGRDPNPSATLTFDNDAVDTYVEQEAAAEHSIIRFALTAPSENNKYYWKKFGNDTQITVVFGYAPRIPSYKSTNTITCGTTVSLGEPGNLEVDITGESVYGVPAMSFAAQAYHSDAANEGPFSSANLARTTGGWDYNGIDRTWSGVIPDLPNGYYGWRASVKTETNINDPAGQAYPDIIKSTEPSVRGIIVDRTPPSIPTITTTDYPDGWWGPSASNPGTFKVSMPSNAEAVAYAFNAELPELPDSSCYPTSRTSISGYKTKAEAATSFNLTAANIRPGVPNTLSVFAFDKAHNVSATKTYVFYVSPVVPGTTTPTRIEAEGSKVTRDKNPALPPETVEITPADNSGPSAPEQYLTMKATDNLAYVDLKFDVNEDGYYAVGAHLKTCPTCGTTKLTIPGENIPTTTHDTYSTTTGSTFVQVGGYHFKAGPQKLRVAFPDADPGTTPEEISIDALNVIRLQGSTYASLEATFNNRGIATAGGISGLLEHDISATPESIEALALDKLDAAGITPGDTFDVTFKPDGVDTVTTTFNIPALTDAQGEPHVAPDNVIAAGQRINMNNALVKHIDFLVASTCGNVPFDPGIQFSLTHRRLDNTTVTTDTGLSAATQGIPDWESPPPSPPQDGEPNKLVPITINGSLRGDPARSRTGNVTLYMLEIDIADANQTRPLLELTLPRTGTTLTQTCTDGPQLHILAMKTR